MVSVGPGKRHEDVSNIPMDIQKGDQVLYSKHAGTDIKLGKEGYMQVGEQDLLAVIV